MPQTQLPPDLYWLTLTGLMTAMLWMPHILRLIFQEGVVAAFRDPEADIKLKPKWANRAKRAHINAQLNFGVFAGLLLCAHILGVAAPWLGIAAMIYFWARLGHYFVYTFGIPWFRPFLFVVGACVQIAIAIKILGHI